MNWLEQKLTEKTIDSIPRPLSFWLAGFFCLAMGGASAPAYWLFPLSVALFGAQCLKLARTGRSAPLPVIFVLSAVNAAALFYMGRLIAWLFPSLVPASVG